MMNSAIFRDYDIRGTYPDQLDESTYELLGKAIATYLRVDTIAVGYDTRLSSPSLFGALTKGIMDQGTNVVNLGNISTEMHYFASGKYGFPANIIVSASHNPPQYNGIKMVIKGVVPLHGEYGFPEIKDLALKGSFTSSETKGTMTTQDVMDAWIDHACSFIDISSLRPLKVVIDAGNGMGGISWEKVLSKLPVKITPLYFEPDGHFPHHLPDPLDVKNLADLQAMVKKEGADFGFAIDGDADRLFLVDGNGRPVSGTVTTAMLTDHLLKKHGPSPILYNVGCGRVVPEIISSHGATGRRVRVGHSFIKQYMKDDNALFAGEHSGHYYFRENFYADSSFIAGLLLLEYISAASSAAEVFHTFDKYPQSGEINFRVSDVSEMMKQIEQSHHDATSVDHIDGISIWYPTWWCNIRASKTEPLLRLNIEADTQEVLSTQTQRMLQHITEAGGVQI